MRSASSDGNKGTRKCLQSDGGIAWIKQAIKGRAAGVHTPCHLDLRNVVLLHGLLHLPRDRFLDGDGTGLLKNAFFFQEVIER